MIRNNQNTSYDTKIRVGAKSVPLIVQPQIKIFSSREEPFEKYDAELNEILNSGNLGIVRMLQKNANE